MKRREFIASLGAATSALVWPLAARAQQPMPVIGFLSARSAKDSVVNVAAFAKGLEEFGFAEGKNLSTEYRFAEGRVDRLPQLAADLVRRPVAVLDRVSLALSYRLFFPTAQAGGRKTGIHFSRKCSNVPVPSPGHGFGS